MAFLALAWGLVAGGALLIGAALAWFAQPSPRLIAWVMAFGSGILISAIAFDMMDEAFARGGLAPTAIGFAAGAIIFTLGSSILDRSGAKHRKRSRPKIGVPPNAGAVIALATVIDGIPESIVIGLSLIDGNSVAHATVVAIFLSNIPEGLSSSAGMKASGRSAFYVFGLWTAVTLISGLASLAGYAVFAYLPPEIVTVTQTIAAGALLAVVADTMIPEAFAEAHEATGLIAALGFLAGFTLSHGLG